MSFVLLMDLVTQVSNPPFPSLPPPSHHNSKSRHCRVFRLRSSIKPVNECHQSSLHSDVIISNSNVEIDLTKSIKGVENPVQRTNCLV